MTLFHHCDFYIVVYVKLHVNHAAIKRVSSLKEYLLHIRMRFEKIEHKKNFATQVNNMSAAWREIAGNLFPKNKPHVLGRWIHSPSLSLPSLPLFTVCLSPLLSLISLSCCLQTPSSSFPVVNYLCGVGWNGRLAALTSSKHGSEPLHSIHTVHTEDSPSCVPWLRGMSYIRTDILSVLPRLTG